MKTFIVFAHPEPKSFGGALLETSMRTLRAQGHEVVVSDLYAMGFDPVAKGSDFTQRRFPDQLQYDREQKFACQHDAFVPAIQAEIDKLLACDLLILQFPLWWFSVPAIMKGWLDRVLANGVAYGKGHRLDAGGLKGRKAMLCTTTGCYPEMMAPDGMLGDREVMLWPLHFGVLFYSGLQVLPPYVAWSIQYSSHEQRQRYLEGYAAHLEALPRAEPLFFHPLADFGPDWRLRPDVTARATGQLARAPKPLP